MRRTTENEYFNCRNVLVAFNYLVKKILLKQKTQKHQVLNLQFLFLFRSKNHCKPEMMGNEMHTIIHNSQTNKQFSCVEATLAPEKIARIPHKQSI
jgi:hypothetical protein